MSDLALRCGLAMAAWLLGGAVAARLYVRSGGGFDG